jgi:predicted ribosomally synthesized peptide with nif11-like leader
MASDQLYLFTALAAFNAHLQEQLKAVDSPQEIVAIAAEKGYAISGNSCACFPIASMRPTGSGAAVASAGGRASSAIRRCRFGLVERCLALRVVAS